MQLPRWTTVSAVVCLFQSAGMCTAARDLDWVHSQEPLPIWVNDCLSVSNVLYATGHGHLRIYDISAPGQLQELGSAPSSAGVDLALLGSTLFQATYGVGVTVFNVADPRNPKLIATMPNGGSSAVEVAGNHVLATAGGLFVVIDPSDVTKPRVVGETRINGGGNSIAVKGDVAFVTAPDTGLHIVDLAEVTAPQRIGGFSTNQQLGPVLIEGDFAFVGAQTGFFTFDIRDARNPVQHRFVSAPPVRDWLVREGRLYALSGSELRAYDVTEPGNPRPQHRVPLRKEMQGLTVEGAFAYLGGFDQLEIISLIRAANPQTITNFTGMGESQSDVKLSGRYAYVTEEAKALHILDMTGESPKLTGTFTNQNSVATAVTGDFAYIADLQRGITVVDVRDPTNPVQVGFYASGRSQDIVVHGTDLYVANYVNGLLILDISSPADPTFVSQLATARFAVGVVVRDEIAYVSGGPAGLHVVDVGNKAIPQILSTIPGGVVCAEVNGTIVYASLTTDEIAVLDCSYPTGPKRIGILPTRSRAVKMMIAENHLYCAELGGGVEVFDVTNASTPHRVGGNSRYTVTSIAASTDRVYFATRGDGLTQSYPFRNASIVRVSRFSPITTLRVEGPPTLTGTLETSSDFFEWTGIESVIFGESGAELLHPGGNATHQFYRLRVE